VTFAISVPQAIARIQAREPTIRAFVSTRLPEAARDHDARAREPSRSPLHGVPFSLKDEWETLCLPTTGGSWRHRDRRSPADSSVMRVFDDAGAILVGKSNLSDLGLAPEASSWVGGVTRNPVDTSRTAGGSSGGAAAAVADGMVGFDWGTDIGGSIRLPAANCGVTGLRLSSETWPVTGLFPMAPPALTFMLAQGPITRTLAEMRAVLDVAAPRLRTGSERGPFAPRNVALYTLERGGLWRDFAADVGPACAGAGLGVRQAADAGLPPPSRARWINAAVWCSHFDDIRSVEPELSLGAGLGAALSAVVLRGRLGDKRIHPVTAELLLQIAFGRAFVFRDKTRALADASDYRSAFQRLWDAGTVVAMPVCAWPAARPGRSNHNPRMLECTFPGNLVDATALALPWGRFADGLPRALQLLGPPGSERALIDLGDRLLASAPARQFAAATN
jgi:amidase